MVSFMLIQSIGVDKSSIESLELMFDRFFSNHGNVAIQDYILDSKSLRVGTYTMY